MKLLYDKFPSGLLPRQQTLDLKIYGNIMEALEKFMRKKTNSPRDDSETKKEPSPRMKIYSRASNRDESPSTRRIVCPRCKTSTNVVLLGKWNDKDADVYFCGLTYPDDRACRNVWMPEFSYMRILEAKICYLPGLEGDYMVSFTFDECFEGKDAS